VPIKGGFSGNRVTVGKKKKIREPSNRGNFAMMENCEENGSRQFALNPGKKPGIQGGTYGGREKPGSGRFKARLDKEECPEEAARQATEKCRSGLPRIRTKNLQER